LIYFEKYLKAATAMDIETYRAYCLSKPFVTEAFPFDEDTLVFKVKGKMFVLFNISDFSAINLKCDPEKAVELREQYSAVQPGYHMNKKHWNTIELDGSITWKLLKAWTDHSFDLVVKSLPGKEREAVLGKQPEKLK
jgi:predicted DNA-binding protein (MmcQ/YjbR family)